MKQILYNGKIYLEREKFAEAVLIKDGIIAKVGTNEEVKTLADTDTELFDCKGNTVIPGLNDSHMHFTEWGETMYQVRINDCRTIDEIIDRCKTFVKEHPERVKNGIHAIGWNQDLFINGDRMPDRFDLDEVSTEIPIVLERVCGHIVSSNTKIIQMLGIDKNSPQFPGGSFLIDKDGDPNGIYTGNACNIVKDLIPDFSMEERHSMVLESMKAAVARGITSVQSNDVGTTFMDGPAAFKMFHDIYENGEGLLRYRHQVCFNNIDDFKRYLSDGEFANGKYPDNSWLTLGPLKLFKDGSLGARTGLMRNGYADDPSNHGLEWTSSEEMEQYCALAKNAGMQVVTHVIGDAAIEQTINCYEKAFVDGENKLRHALVHCQITDKPLLERIVKDGILVMAQPIFLDYDMRVVEDRCGKELASTSYAFHSLAKMGGRVSYGTDCPVEDCNPFPNIYEAVTRKDKTGFPKDGFYPDECVDVYTAVDAYTKESAYAEFMETKKGRIKEGQYGDLVILDKDIFTVDPMEIKDIKPLLTMVGGKVVFQREF